MPAGADQQLQLRVRSDPDLNVVEVKGCLGADTARHLALVLKAMARGSTALMLLDLRPADWLDPAGLALIHAGLCDCGIPPDGLEIQVRSQGQPESILSKAGFYRFFPIVSWLTDPDTLATLPNTRVIELRLPSDVSQVSRARSLTEHILMLSQLDGVWMYDFLAAIGEALSNAVTHGSPTGSPGYVLFSLSPESDGVIAEIQDYGKGIRNWTGRPTMPSAHSVRGRGLSMMQILSDSMDITTSPDGTSVRLVKRWPASGAAPLESGGSHVQIA